MICNLIQPLVSQLHQHGKIEPKRLSNQLWDLAAAVKCIALQYEVDHLTHSQSPADHTYDNDFANHFPVSSNSPSSCNQDSEPRTPSIDPLARPLPVCTTDYSNRRLPEPQFADLSLPITSSYTTDPPAIPSRHGTCRPSDLMPPPNLHDSQSPTYRSKPGNRVFRDQLALRSPNRE